MNCKPAAYLQILIPLLKTSLLKSPYKMNPAFFSIYTNPHQLALQPSMNSLMHFLKISTLLQTIVLTKSNNDNISHVHATEAFSDHFSITFKVNITPQRRISGDTVTFRKYHKINMEAMRKDLLSSELIVDPKNNSDALYSQDHSTLTTLIDKHAPFITKHVRSKYIPGWVNDSVIAAKETKCLFERLWRKNKSSFNRSQYIKKVHMYNKICMKAKSDFLKSRIHDNQDNPQKLWQTLSDVLHRSAAKVLPSVNSPQLLANKFVEFFTEKITNIRQSFANSNPPKYTDSDLTPPVFSAFSSVSEDQVAKIIKNSPSKSCSLDPWPTFLVIEFLDILITPITSVIHASLREGSCPKFFKQAHVTPLLKKSTLDREVLKNYRPVSNLNFVSKILERVVSSQLLSHLDESCLLTGFQSAYRRFHSTESALLNIQDDLFLNMSEGSTTALTLLDLSAAFDTIDHSILFHRLHDCYGINGLALSWFESYLSDRTQSVKVGSVLSHPMVLKFGVPQGSVLGPLLFSMYTNPLSSIIQSHRGIKHHFYADDTQLYITLSPSNFSQSMTALTDCLNDIQNFMAANKLKLNPDKTEFILIGSKYSRKQLHSLFPTDILGNKVSPASNVKNLGVVFDPNLTLTDHISQVIKSTRFHIRDLYRIRHLLDLNTAILLANALVSSQIDYCNSLFASLTLSELKRLQGVQNSLCRVVTRTSRYTHATPNLEKLHWLPVKYRVLFKIGLITYKVLKYGQPVYLKDKLHPYTSSRNTRRSSPKS